jgi:UDP-N-acetylmuramyl pentapeptide synthase
MKDGGAVDVVQRAGIDKQLIETVGRYAKPEHVVLQLDHTLIPRKSQKFGEIQQDIAGALGARTIDEGAMDEKNGMNFVNALEKIPGIIAQYEERTAKLKADVPQLEAIVAKTWGKENELKQLKYKKWKAQFLNGDDDKLTTVQEVKGSTPVFFGSGNQNAIYADHYENRGLNGSRAQIHIDDVVFPVEIPLPGEHMLYDALAAAAVGAFFGLTPTQIQEGIQAVEAVDGRSHVMHTSHYTLIDDCYNANPVSVKAALDLLSMTNNSDKNTRKVAILGDMFELGAEEKALHREVGVYAAQKGLDVVICVGKLCKNMFDGAQSVSCVYTTCYYFVDKEALFFEIGKILQNGDLVLVKASHGMHFEEIIKQLS